MILALLAIVVLLFVVLPLIGMALWAFLTTLVVGLVIGALGRLVVPGRQAMGLLATVVCGLIGSIIGGFFGQHVLHAGSIITVILEVIVAAVAVGLFAGTGGSRVSSTR